VLQGAAAEHDGDAFDELSEALDAYTVLFDEHHHAEDLYFFPALLSVERGLAVVIERLVTQHEALASRLMAVREQMHRDRTPGDTSERPQRLIVTLTDLRDVVDAHLALEEAETVPALSTWTRWPL
jgi:iron-sulfur cluster repair protein YtfE (RIC family)